MNELVLIVGAAVFGAVIGSFLNVVILRSFTGRSLAGRSSCATCSTPLSWYELVPIASFCVQRGRCRTCGARISWQYVSVELITATLFALTASQLSLLPTTASVVVALYYAVVMSLIVVIGVYDVKHKIIPNRFVYSLIILSALFVVMDFSWGRLLAGPVLAAPLALMWLVSHGRWIGLGDAKLVWAFGWFLGLVGGLSAVIFGFWIGAVFGIALIVVQRMVQKSSASLKTEIPFGPFLLLGFLLVLFTGMSATDVITSMMHVLQI